MSDLTPLESKMALDVLIYEAKNDIGNVGKKGLAGLEAASLYLNKIATGEYAKPPCTMVVPNGIGDCAGSRDEWFRRDFCRKCHKYGNKD